MARADSLTTRTKALGIGSGDLAGNFDSIRQGVEQLAVSGDPRAAVMIGALHDGTLYAQRRPRAVHQAA